MDALTLLTILLMALATYATRALGYLLLANRALGPRARRLLEAAPGCVLVAVIAPAFVARNPADLLALWLTVWAATRLPMPATVLTGISASALLRLLFG